MAILVMDTATDTLGVGIGSTDGHLLTGVVQRIPRGHSRLLQPSIRFAMESSGLNMSDIEAIGIGVGPGSYTGVRMAVATGKAMAHALNVPVIPISTLEAVAQLAFPGLHSVTAPSTNVRENGTPVVLTMLHARRHRAFGGVYEWRRGLWLSSVQPEVKAISAWFEDSRVRTAAHVAILHDFPPSEPMPEAMPRESVLFSHWSDVSSGFPGALLRVSLVRLDQQISGVAVHQLAPDYALPVEAETKIAVNPKGGRQP